MSKIELIECDLNEYIDIESENQFDCSNFIHSNFLQSSKWAHFQLNYGFKCSYLYFKKESEIIGYALLIHKSYFRSFLKFAYIPRGPVIARDLSKDDLRDIVSLLKSYSQNKFDFLRIEPNNTDLFNDDLLKRSLYKVDDMQPSRTAFIDLNVNIDDLLAKMKSKTRYNIRLASKKHLVFSENKDKDTAFSHFITLLKETSQRDSFVAHSYEYYRKMINCDNSFIRVFEVSYKSRVIVSAICSFYQNKVSYLHGASSDDHKNLMAPYLLQFQIMQIAKNEGYGFYDLYGIDKDKWPGVTRFKMGFSPKEFVYPGTFDLVFLSWKYKIFYLLKSFKKALKL